MIYVVMGEEQYRDGGEPLAYSTTHEGAKKFLAEHRRENQTWYVREDESLRSYDEFQENPIYEEHNKTKLASPLYWAYYWIVEVPEAE